MKGPLVECVPNVSEGRDRRRVDSAVASVLAVPGVVLLHRTSDPDHNRSVLTFVAPPEAAVEAAVRLAAKAAELIDLNEQRGEHPRLGALDVFPFVPLVGVDMQDCVQLAKAAGARIWNEVGIPVYFYEAAAQRPDRTRLENVRRGQFERLRDAVLFDETKQPDLGGPGLHPTAGAVIVGARKILIAYNINLKSNDLGIANSIAKRVRESSGGLPGVKALGIPLRSRDLVQVSMNITDHERTPVHVVFSEVARLAAGSGVEIEGSELIGLMPRRAIEMAAANSLMLPDFQTERILENRVDELLLSG
jgi:glutamate formiminotransferase